MLQHGLPSAIHATGGSPPPRSSATILAVVLCNDSARKHRLKYFASSGGRLPPYSLPCSKWSRRMSRPVALVTRPRASRGRGAALWWRFSGFAGGTAAGLVEDGASVTPWRAPAAGQALLRSGCMSTHTAQDVERLIDAMMQVGNKLPLRVS